MSNPFEDESAVRSEKNLDAGATAFAVAWAFIAALVAAEAARETVFAPKHS